MGIDDNNCIANVKTSISVLKNLIDNYYTKDYNKNQNDVSNECVKTIIEKVIGNNDPFWVELIKKLVLKIVEMEDGTESSINNLLGENNKFTSAQLFEIDKLVTTVCLQLNIKLDKSAYHKQIVGLPYNIPFIKRKMSNNNYELCPICGSKLMKEMPSGVYFICNKCDKKYINNNGNVGNEITDDSDSNPDIIK